MIQGFDSLHLRHLGTSILGFSYEAAGTGRLFYQKAVIRPPAFRPGSVVILECSPHRHPREEEAPAWESVWGSCRSQRCERGRLHSRRNIWMRVFPPPDAYHSLVLSTAMPRRLSSWPYPLPNSSICAERHPNIQSFAFHDSLELLRKHWLFRRSPDGSIGLDFRT